MEEEVHGEYVSDDDITDGMELLKSYEEKAKTLGKDEVMLIMAPSQISLMRRHKNLNKPYVQTIERIKETLRDRAVVFLDNSNFFDGEETRNKIKSILNARGYYFDQSVLTEAYGETIGCCVDDAAEGLNREEKLDEKTVIKVDLTNGRGGDPEADAKRAERWGYKHITFE